MKNLILIFLFAISTFDCAIAQQLIEPEKLKDDIDFLVTKYESIHPNLYAYISRDSFYADIDILKGEISDSLYSFVLWSKLRPIINSLNDGHTSISPNYDDIQEYYKTDTNVFSSFPLSVFIIDSTIYLRRIYGNDKVNISPGSVITKINDITTEEIVKKFINNQSGEKKDYRLHNIQIRFIEYMNNFYHADGYRIEYVEKEQLKLITLLGVSENIIRDYYDNEFKDYPNYEFKIIENNIGLLEYNNCSGYETFKKFLDTTFTIIRNKGIENLIIDLRKNGGGNSDLNDLLFTYVYDKPFNSFGKIEVKISEDIRNSIDYYSKFENDTIIYMDTYKANSPINNLLFKGNVYLLTSIESFSSGADCAMLFKDYEVGTIIGQETGGLPTSYGDTYKFSLPNTGITAKVSWKYFVRPSGVDDGKGVIPDIPIKYGINDLINKKDLEMEFVLKQINSE